MNYPYSIFCDIIWVCWVSFFNPTYRSTKIYNVKLRKLSTNTMILNTSIALRIRGKPIAVGFAVWLIISQLCGGCKDTSKSDYLVKTMGSCNQQASIRIIDETNGIASNARMRNSPGALPFKNYVNTISKYVFTKIDEMGACKGNWQDDPQVELVFIYRPLTDCKIAPFNFEQTRSDDFKQLDSPWVKLSMSRSPKPIVRAAFLWNERQFAFDQAILLDPQIVPIKPLLPLKVGSYSGSIYDDYEKYRDAPSKEAEAAARVKLFKRLPPDIIWLFHHSGNFGMDATNKIARESADRYTNLTKLLIDRRFSSGQAQQQYESVLDLKDVFNLDKYRIKTLHYY
jgi:hypothetical protein